MTPGGHIGRRAFLFKNTRFLAFFGENMSKNDVSEQADDREDERDRRQNAREKLAEILEEIEVLKMTVEQLGEIAKLHAQLTRARFEALVKVGFDQQQAMNFVLNGWG